MARQKPYRDMNVTADSLWLLVMQVCKHAWMSNDKHSQHTPTYMNDYLCKSHKTRSI